MVIAVSLVLAVVLIFFFERPGEKESKFVSALVYLILGAFPLNLFSYSLPLGIPVALTLLLRKVENRQLKIIAAIAGAVAGWVYFTWFRVPG